MRKIHQYAYAARWILLIVGILCVLSAVTLYVNAAHADPIFLVILAVFFITQWLFLLPRRGWRFRLTQQVRPMKVSIAVGALVLAFVSFGLFMAMWELLVERGSIDVSSVLCWSNRLLPELARSHDKPLLSPGQCCALDACGDICRVVGCLTGAGIRR